MIYQWEKLKNCRNKSIAAYNRELSPDRFMFLDGIPLTTEQVNKKPIFEQEITQARTIKYDCIPNNCGSPLVNQKIVDLLLRLAPDDVQFFDAEVRCKDGILTGYKLLNATHTIVGIDHEKSIYTMMKESPTAILGFKYLTYKPGCMGNIKIARDREYLSNFLVAEEIKQAFEKEKITGIWFATPEEWYSLVSDYRTR
jgi:hypothetical protein